METNFSQLMNSAYYCLVISGTIGLIQTQKMSQVENVADFRSVLEVTALSFQLLFLLSFVRIALKSPNPEIISSIALMLLICGSNFFSLGACFTWLIWLFSTALVVILSMQQIIEQTRELKRQFKNRIYFLFKKNQQEAENVGISADSNVVMRNVDEAARTALNAATNAAIAERVAVQASLNAEALAAATQSHATTSQIHAMTSQLHANESAASAVLSTNSTASTFQGRRGLFALLILFIGYVLKIHTQEYGHG